MDRSPTLAICVLPLVILLCGPPLCCAESDGRLRVATEGSRLSEAEANALEEALEAKPNDLRSRAKLLGYYFLRHRSSPDARARRAKHVLWVIEHHPDSDIAGSPYAQFDPILDADAHAQAKALWRKQVERRPDDVDVLGNAASAALREDGETAEALLERAKALEPRNPDWPRELAHLHHLRARHAPSAEAKKASAEKALAEQEQALALASKATDQFYLLSDIPDIALEAGKHERARAAAEQLLEEARRHPRNWNYGNAIHKAHTALGRLALLSGDVDQARQHLLDAGKTPGSPQLNSFGPDLTLADALLARGERETVAEYLKSVERFWELGRAKTERWVKMIEAGNDPDLSPAARATPEP